MDTVDVRGSIPRLEGGFGFPLGFGVGVVVTTVSVAFGATSYPEWALVVEGGAVAAVSTITTVAASVATAAVCWALYDGFVLERAGNLVLTAVSGQAALVLLVVALAATMLGALARTVLARPGLTDRYPGPSVSGPRTKEPVGQNRRHPAVGR